MNKLDKLQILTSINEIPLSTLKSFIEKGDISLEEMKENNLDANKIKELQFSFYQVEDQKRKNRYAEQLCREIEQGKYTISAIKDKLQQGEITEADLKSYTSLTGEEIHKIINHQTVSTNFDLWDDDIHILEGRTDVFFFGIQGSGKSCIMASLIHYLTDRGLVIENRDHLVGAKYRDQLGIDFKYGILPQSTDENRMTYMPIELSNIDDNSKIHPLNIIEMSGEVFRKSYENGIDEKLKRYLGTSNKKILFFVIDYNRHTNNLQYDGKRVDQNTLLTGVLTDLDRFGTLNNTDAIIVLITKSDLFPDSVNKKEYGENFIANHYALFKTNLLDLKEKYMRKSDFYVGFYPYSIGEVKFKDLVVKVNSESPEHVVSRIQDFSFFRQRNRGWRRWFS